VLRISSRPVDQDSLPRVRRGRRPAFGPSTRSRAVTGVGDGSHAVSTPPTGPGPLFWQWEVVERLRSIGERGNFYLGTKEKPSDLED
jgi:hypothetical protein